MKSFTQWIEAQSAVDIALGSPPAKGKKCRCEECGGEAMCYKRFVAGADEWSTHCSNPDCPTNRGESFPPPPT